jgi:hypothetical protein
MSTLNDQSEKLEQHIAALEEAIVNLEDRFNKSDFAFANITDDDDARIGTIEAALARQHAVYKALEAAVENDFYGRTKTDLLVALNDALK